MKFLNYNKTEDASMLNIIDNQWPVQFSSGFVTFQKNFFNEVIEIAFDETSGAMMPVRFLNLKVFTLAQILFAPVKDAVELNAKDQLIFFEQFIIALKKRGNCERIAQPSTSCVLSSVPQNSESCEFGSYIVDLENQTNEDILNKFHPKYQKAITHSINNNAEVRFGKNVLSDFYKTYEQTMKRVNMHFDKLDFFESTYSNLGENNVCCAVVYDNGEPISGIFLTYSKYSAFLTHAGTISGSKLYGAAKLLNYEAMKHLKEKGVKRYDFVGVRTKNNTPELEGVARFKKGFGGDLKTGYLWKKDLLPIKAGLLDAVLYLKSKGNTGKDIIDQVNESNH